MYETPTEIRKAWLRAFIVTLLACCCLSITSLSGEHSPADLYLGLYLVFVVAGLTGFVLLGRAFVLSIDTKQWPSYYLLGGLTAAITATTLIELHSQGVFYGREVLTASFKDDLSYLELQLYEDGHYIMTSSFLFGSDTFRGRYTRSDTTLTFDQFPVIENDFVAQTVRVKGNRIYFRPTNQDSSYYHFTIRRL